MHLNPSCTSCRVEQTSDTLINVLPVFLIITEAPFETNDSFLIRYFFVFAIDIVICLKLDKSKIK